MCSMMRRGKALAAAVVTASLFSGCAARASAPTTLPSDIRAGAEVFVAWDCLPQWSAEIVGQMVNAAGQLGPCYGERLKILTVLRDGWVEAADASDGSVWMVNLRRAMAVQPVRPSLKAD